MFDDEPRIGGQQSSGCDATQEVGKFMCHGIGRISEKDPIGAIPSVRPLEKVLHSVRVNCHAIGNPALCDILAQQSERYGIGFYTGHVCCAAAQGFNADGPGSRIEIKKLALHHPVPND